jgi:hypothetical protein
LRVFFVALPMPQASFSFPPPSHFHVLCSVIPTPQKGNKGVKDRPTIVVTSEHNLSVRVWLMRINTFVPKFSIRKYTPFESYYSRQTMRWSLRGVNILSAVRGEYRAGRWTEDFLLVSAKMT